MGLIEDLLAKNELVLPPVEVIGGGLEAINVCRYSHVMISQDAYLELGTGSAGPSQKRRPCLWSLGHPGAAPKSIEA